MYKELVLKIASTRTFRDIVTQSSAGRSLVDRFVAGEALPQAIAAVRDLNAQGIKASVDFLGEEIFDLAQGNKTKQDYLNLLNGINREGVCANVSLKLTQLGLAINPSVAKDNLAEIAEYAMNFGNFIRIDMEGSSFTQPTLDIFYNLFPNHPNLGVVTQAYLYRSVEDLERLNQIQARVRLCKGAYKEPANIAYPKKRDVDINYRNLMGMLLRDGNFPAIATHDQKMIDSAKDFSQSVGRGKDEFEFQMLYGVRTDMQQKLAKEGWGMRVYVPFGKDWYAYLTRRLAERPANLFFILKHLV